LKEVKILEDSTKQLKYDISKLCWYMRGSLSLTEAYESSPEDREIMSKLIEENLKLANKTGKPFW
jgi:hypothetical protein